MTAEVPILRNTEEYDKEKRLGRDKRENLSTQSKIIECRQEDPPGLECWGRDIYKITVN